MLLFPAVAWEGLSAQCLLFVIWETADWCVRCVASSQVEISTLDVADLGETKEIVAMANGMAPVGGIFHLAMILQDRWMSNQVHTLACGLPHITHAFLSNICC